MKKVKKIPNPDLLNDYDFSKGVRGKYAKRCVRGSNVVLLAPDVARLFPNSAAVNYALHSLAEIIRHQPKDRPSLHR